MSTFYKANSVIQILGTWPQTKKLLALQELIFSGWGKRETRENRHVIWQKDIVVYETYTVK